MIKIKDIVASTAWYSDQHFLVVKIETDFPEYYGIGCTALKSGGHEHVSVFSSDVRPTLVGRTMPEATSAASIAHCCDVVTSTVLSAVNLALWNLQGKLEKKNAYAELSYYRMGS